MLNKQSSDLRTNADSLKNDHDHGHNEQNMVSNIEVDNQILHQPSIFPELLDIEYQWRYC